MWTRLETTSQLPCGFWEASHCAVETGGGEPWAQPPGPLGMVCVFSAQGSSLHEPSAVHIALRHRPGAWARGSEVRHLGESGGRQGWGGHHLDCTERPLTRVRASRERELPTGLSLRFSSPPICLFFLGQAGRLAKG